jgi:hypothetical protein
VAITKSEPVDCCSIRHIASTYSGAHPQSRLNASLVLDCRCGTARYRTLPITSRAISKYGKRTIRTYGTFSALSKPTPPERCGIPALCDGRGDRDRTACGAYEHQEGASASLREGLDETLTVLRLCVTPTLARALRSTNTVESMMSVSHKYARNVKRWRDGNMALRWCAADMVEAGKQFRRVNVHLHLPALRAARDREFAEVGPSCTMTVHNHQVSAD